MYCRWGSEYFTLVDDYLPVEGNSSRYHVLMRVESITSALKTLQKRYSDNRHSIVGWYHSHPGHGVLLPDTDVKSQITFFNQPQHVALVVDHIKKTYGFFKLSTDNEPVRVSYAIWSEAYE